MKNQKDHFIPLLSRSNRRAESSNKVLMNNLKKWLEEAKGRWRKELSGILWAYMMMTKTSTCKTPFSLVSRSEALILVGIGEPSLRCAYEINKPNHEALAENLDLVEGH